jgi:2-polyprenyl-6-methoxyphenol hydroxylase-like FAD-dependent oxidoreductase
MQSDVSPITNESTDVLIVGAGPTGLMAGLLLHHCGINFRILDKNPQPAIESRAFALQARSLELLQNLGIVDKFLNRGVIALGMQIYVNGDKAVEFDLSDIGSTNTPYSFILMLPQSEIEKILIAELNQRGIQIEYHSEITNLTQTQNEVTITAINEQGPLQIKANYLIGADGAHSIVRNELGLSFLGDAYPQNFLLADCRIEWPLEYAFAKIFFSQNHLGVYLPIKGKALGRIIAMNPSSTYKDSAAAKLATTAEPVPLNEIEKIFQQACHVPVKLSDPIWVSRYRIHHRGVNTYSIGRVFVAGDAAHIHSPAGGQGMNTGLQDAANLVWKLALVLKGEGSVNLLNTYNEERWPIGQKLLHFTDKLFGRISAQNRFIVAIRNKLIPIIMKIVISNRQCRTRAFHFISQLGIHYHANAFLLDDVAKNSRNTQQLSAGHRAPNAIYKRNHDVFNLIRGYHFHVLALSKKSLSQEEIETMSQDLAQLPKHLGLPLQTYFIAHSLVGENEKIIQAESNQIFEHYGLSNSHPHGLFLIRPDGYIAYRSDEINVKNLIKFCHLFQKTNGY